MYVTSSSSEALKGSRSRDSIKSLETFTFAIGCTCKIVIYSGDEKQNESLRKQHPFLKMLQQVTLPRSCWKWESDYVNLKFLVMALKSSLFFLLFSFSVGAATTHIYILDVVQKKGEMNFQILFLLHCLFIMHSVVAHNAWM